MCVTYVFYACQVREALEGREAVLVTEARRLFDCLDHTLHDRVTCWGPRVMCDVPVLGVRALCRVIGEISNVAGYCDEAVVQ